ncbi:MAG: MFS transporter [Lachnospiraceae bacterium]|nr:MFS transporter [Lachnospiraceae bacterium]
MRIFATKEQNRQFYFSYGAFMINGMLALSIGALLPFIRDARGLEYAFAGFLVSMHSVGNLVASFAAGALPLLIGRKKSILFFNAFSAVSYGMILAGGSNLLLVLAFFLTGLARGAASNYCNMKINYLAPGKAWSINGLHAMFSVGAFLFPILLTVLTRKSEAGWVYACGFMFVMSIVSWFLYLLIPEEQDKVVKSGKKGADMGFFKEPLFYLCIATLFFYLCAEQGVIGWMITYFKDTGLLAPSLSQITASVLWIMILAGRLTVAWLSTKIKKEKLLVVMGIGLVLFFLLLILSRSTLWIMVGIMGFGYSMAGIYPTTVSSSGNMIQKYPLAWSFILTGASLGSIIMPSVIGKIAETAGIFYGMSSIAAVLLIDLVCILSLVAYMGRQQTREGGVQAL